MTSLWRRLALAVVMAGLTQVGASATSQYLPPPTVPQSRMR